MIADYRPFGFAYRRKVASELLAPCAILTCTAFATSFTRIRLLFVSFS